MTNETASPTRTPWGDSQTVDSVIDGITAHSTASHGGWHLSDDRIAALVEMDFPRVWTKDWYEEDCEVSCIVLAFPGEFAPAIVRNALDMVMPLAAQVGGTWQDLWEWASFRPEVQQRAGLNFPVDTECPMCGSSTQVLTNGRDYDRWRGGLVIQEAMPYLSLTEREMLQTGICGPCWDHYMVPSDE